jgi:nickel/cobalt transporter (NicO) family protein
MFNPLLLDSLLLGIQHSFEPDHVAAVSVLATEKNKQSNHKWRLVWRSSQWALGHSLTLISFGVLVLILKSTLSLHVAEYVEFLIGPIMIWLGVSAILRNFKKEERRSHTHTNTHSGNMFSRSFWIGMIHGLAGTGGACAIALTLAARDAYTAVLILLIQSIAIIVAMTSYGCLFALSVNRFAGKWQPSVKAINYIVGIFSMTIGVFCLLESIQKL